MRRLSLKRRSDGKADILSMALCAALAVVMALTAGAAGEFTADAAQDATVQDSVAANAQAGAEASLAAAKTASIPSSKKYGTQYKKRKKYKGPSKWKSAVAGIEKKNSKAKTGRVIFYGSSSIRKWSSLKEDMAPLAVSNHGFGGCTVNDCVYYADRLIVPYKPEAIVFYAGTNDIAFGYSPKVVYKRTLNFISYIHKALPDTRIYYVEQTRQPKRNKYWSKMKKLNKYVKNYAAKDPMVTFISTRKALNTSKDKARKKYFVKDKLHFSKKGYAVWASVIRPVLYGDLL